MTVLLWTVAGVASAWLLWIFAHLVAMALIRHSVPTFTGFRIDIPHWCHVALQPEQLGAVIAHEEGHRHHRHVWKNFARFCLFLPIPPLLREQQELEADDYAIPRVGPMMLAAAIAAMPCDDFANQRIRRLLLYAQHNQPAGPNVLVPSTTSPGEHAT